MRPRSGQRYSPSSLGDSRVLATARHTLVCLRVAVQRDSPKPRRFRSARPRTCPRLAFSSALGAPSRPSSLAPAPQSASPAPFIADSRRLALSLAFSLALVGLRSSPCAAPRRAWRELNPPASLSSLIGPRRRASLVPHEANAPHVLPGAHTGFSPQSPARLVKCKHQGYTKTNAKHP